MTTLFMYTDGSCKGNRNVSQVISPAGWGIVIVPGQVSPENISDSFKSTGDPYCEGIRIEYGEPVAELCGPVILNPADYAWLGATVASNNTAELSAIGESLRWIVNNADKLVAYQDIVIKYDSEYAAKSVLGIFNGQKNKELILTIRDLLIEARQLLKGESKGDKLSQIVFSHVKGHSGHVWNDRADLLANQGATYFIH